MPPALRPPVLKIGGSLITDKACEGVFREDCARRIALEIKRYGMPLFLVHGTGSFGKPLARGFGYMDGLLSRDQAAIVSHVEAVLDDLRGRFLRVLRAAGVAACSVAPSVLFGTRGGSLCRCAAAPLRRLVKTGICPVLSGGIVPDEEAGFAVLSSDAMASRIAVELAPCRLVLATDVPGLIDPDARTPSPEVLSEGDPRISAWITRALDDVSGGMEGKLTAGFAAARAGAEVHLVDGRIRGRLLRALHGSDVISTRLLAQPAASRGAVCQPDIRSGSARPATG
jgi:glutamate 5-kinase